MLKREYDPEKIEAAVSLYRDVGASMGWLSDKYNVSRKTVRRWLVEAGVPVRRRGPMSRCDVGDETLRALWEDMSVPVVEIGRRLGVSPWSVRRRARWLPEVEVKEEVVKPEEEVVVTRRVWVDENGDEIREEMIGYEGWVEGFGEG